MQNYSFCREKYKELYFIYLSEESTKCLQTLDVSMDGDKDEKNSKN